MSKALISLLAVAFVGTAFAQSQTTALDALEMDVLNPGEKPEQALERMSTRPHKGDNGHTPAEAAVMEERPISPTTFGSTALSPSEKREFLPSNSDRAHEQHQEREREKEKVEKVEKDDGHEASPKEGDGDHQDRDGKGDKGKKG